MTDVAAPGVQVVQVLGPIPEGGIVVLAGIPGEQGGPEFVATLVEELRGQAGHDRFTVVMVPPGGIVEVYDAATDAAEVRELLRPLMSPPGPPPPCPMHYEPMFCYPHLGVYACRDRNCDEVVPFEVGP